VFFVTPFIYLFIMIQNPKYRKISTTSKAYTEKILQSPGAVKLLAVAGFKPSVASVAPAQDHLLELSHKNAAILTLITQVID